MVLTYLLAIFFFFTSLLSIIEIYFFLMLIISFIFLYCRDKSIRNNGHFVLWNLFLCILPSYFYGKLFCSKHYSFDGQFLFEDNLVLMLIWEICNLQILLNSLLQVFWSLLISMFCDIVFSILGCLSLTNRTTKMQELERKKRSSYFVFWRDCVIF